MNIVITGANGFVGQALVSRLLRLKALNGTTIRSLRLFDQTFSIPMSDTGWVQYCEGDLCDQHWLQAHLCQLPVDVIFHLASIPGGVAERNYRLARDVNLEATTRLLEYGQAQVMAGGQAPIFVFASSIAVFGDMPDQVGEQTPPNPTMSYGTHKAIGELLVNDFSRRGWVQGRSLRLPGVLARPKQRTGQVSAFLSDIIWEVSAGQSFVCPISAQSRTWASSRKNVVDNLIQAAGLKQESLAGRCQLTLPTLWFSMAQLVDAISQVAQVPGESLVSYAPDPLLEKWFGSYPALDTSREQALGLYSDNDLQTLVRQSTVSENRS
ncbi:NAD-dependent epimerase/dehydratase family protein [Gynuella sunshinyii]|uniref:Nucleoside-diphosphate-sugar epimerase n=1 Tax=Gynuella sunshinyii YC6258 TaxID=1445510 RepID=A0A0C5VZ43_9GAMM|nr:NAD-dependent epimerase/dehydratase family protein [Gynuella sunshinyii]AJQ95689.1 nucleoside-diphosphate-sugar epimerase [Gynuella sunshinyii YC6258]